jgi:putative ABC transport system permease protein
MRDAVNRLLRRVWSLLRLRRLDADLAEELEFHRAMKQRALEESGLAERDARFEAHRAMGNIGLARDRARDLWQPRWLQGFGVDFRLALRLLVASPVLSTVAIASLALGIGANTAIFSLVNSLLLRTLPVAEPERLVLLSTDASAGRRTTDAWNYGLWEEIRLRAPQMFDGAVAWSATGTQDRLNLSTAAGEVQPVDSAYVSGDFFTTLGVPALLGRAFTSADDVRGGGPDGPVAVISYGMWQRRFGGDANVIGAPLVIERIPFTIIGVTPPEFFGAEVGRTFDVALPLNANQLIRGKDSAIDGGSAWLYIMVRVKPGQSAEAATSLLRSVQPQIREALVPATLPPEAQDPAWRQLADQVFLKNPFTLVPASMGTSQLRRRYERPLLATLVIVGLVLLIACGNIANLLLARATARRHELSVRLALGATRWRLVRLLLVEALVLAGTGALAGLVFARWAGPMLVAQLSTSVTRVTLDLPLDWRVLVFTVAVTAATAVLFGTAPAFRARRVAPIDALKEQGRGALGDGRGGLSGSLVVAQVALSMVLIVAAGLLVGTFERLATLPLGFDADRVLTVNVDVTRAPIDPSGRIPFFHQLAAAVAAVPGVARSGASIAIPVGGNNLLDVIDLPGAPPPQLEPGPVPFWNSRMTMHNEITPGFLATYGTAVLAGRDIDERDVQGALPIALVNEAYAHKFLRGRDPIGETVMFAGGGTAPPRTIVGVVRDAVYVSVRDGVRPTVYLPLAQRESGGPLGVTANVNISVRPTAGSPASLAPGVTAALMAVDRNLAFTFRPLQDRIDASLTQERLVALVTGFFGTLALLLAGLGLYGVTSYAVTRRRAEIGIRMALGAEPTGVVRLVLVQVFVLVALGMIIGTAVSVWSSQFLASLLYGLQPRDAVTLVSAAVTLTVVGVVAGWLPAYRASRIDPTEVLRES